MQMIKTSMKVLSSLGIDQPQKTIHDHVTPDTRLKIPISRCRQSFVGQKFVLTRRRETSESQKMIINPFYMDPEVFDFDRDYVVIVHGIYREYYVSTFVIPTNCCNFSCAAPDLTVSRASAMLARIVSVMPAT